MLGSFWRSLCRRSTLSHGNKHCDRLIPTKGTVRVTEGRTEGVQRDEQRVQIHGWACSHATTLRLSVHIGKLDKNEFVFMCFQTMEGIDLSQLDEAMRMYSRANEMLKERLENRNRRIADHIDRIARFSLPLSYYAAALDPPLELGTPCTLLSASMRVSFRPLCSLIIIAVLYESLRSFRCHCSSTSPC